VEKSLLHLGAKVSSTQKNADDRLKKHMDEQNAIKHKLNSLLKKDSPSFLQKDLGDIVYEKKIQKSLFVNTYGSEIMTTVLVAVPKAKVEQFKTGYLGYLVELRRNEFEGWKKRA
jgi:hypothetical protein